MTRDTASARLGLFDHRHGWQMGLFAAASTVLFVTIVQIGTAIELFGTGESAITVDFYVFWAAAKLALQGVPHEAFEVTRLQQAAGLTDTDWMPWAYPPGFLLLVAPFGLLPFTPAWAAFNAAGLTALLLALRPFAAGRPQVLLAVGLAPAMLPCLLVGQTTLLWLAGLIGALAALRAHRPVLAGVLIGLLTLKPQLGLLIPCALIAAGYWRSVFAAAVTTVLLVAGPTVLFGTAYLTEMLAMMEQHGDTVRGAIAGLTLMISPYSTLAALGIPEPAALALQWTLTAGCALAVALAWRSPSVDFDTRAAILLTAIPLASPYLWHYESAFLAPAALFMLRAGILTTHPAGVVLGLAMWLGLGPSALTLALVKTGGADVFRLVFAPVALAAFATVLRHAFRRPGPSPAASSENPH